MPAESEAQRRLMAAARAYKRGEYKGTPSAKIKELAAGMSDKDLTDFMTTKESSGLMTNKYIVTKLLKIAAEKKADATQALKASMSGTPTTKTMPGLPASPPAKTMNVNTPAGGGDWLKRLQDMRNDPNLVPGSPGKAPIGKATTMPGKDLKDLKAPTMPKAASTPIGAMALAPGVTIGGLIGLMNARKGQKARGAAMGVGQGAGIGAGALLGGLGGSALGGATEGALGLDEGSGSILGGAAGALLGGPIGLALMRSIQKRDIEHENPWSTEEEAAALKEKRDAMPKTAGHNVEAQKANLALYAAMMGNAINHKGSARSGESPQRIENCVHNSDPEHPASKVMEKEQADTFFRDLRKIAGDDSWVQKSFEGPEWDKLRKRHAALLASTRTKPKVPAKPAAPVKPVVKAPVKQEN